MISGDAVLMAAEKVAEDVFQSYKRPPMTVQEFKELWGSTDPWHEFTEACRVEAAKHAGTLVVLPSQAARSPIAGTKVARGRRVFAATSARGERHRHPPRSSDISKIERAITRCGFSIDGPGLCRLRELYAADRRCAGRTRGIQPRSKHSAGEGAVVADMRCFNVSVLLRHPVA
jgi:hypothetical protein